jgi:hypothetical protein
LPREVGQQFLHEARLADPGQTEHGEQLAGAIADRLVERVAQPPTLTLPPHHRRDEAPLLTANLADVDHVPRRVDLVGDYSVTDQPVGCGVDYHLAACGDPCRSSQRFARRSALARDILAGDHLAGADTHPPVQPDRPPGPQLRRKLG